MGTNPKRAPPTDLLSHFGSSTKRATTMKTQKQRSDAKAERLALLLNAEPIYLTKDGTSWYILSKKWTPSSPELFEKEWNLHPTNRHPLKLFGRTVFENRWSQSWGFSYKYSGSENKARPLHESSMVPVLVDEANELIEKAFQDSTDRKVDSPYNGCLQNWYQPDDTIGLHSDDESSLCSEYPIFSLSWGGPRRFVFRARETKERIDLLLEDGDLLVMGGKCQETHRHEVPKRRVTMDPPTSNRINWTIRAFKSPRQAEKQSQLAVE